MCLWPRCKVWICCAATPQRRRSDAAATPQRLLNPVCLQLGAGVSLPGVVAARCGAEVILSDSADKPLCLQNCRRSCEANGLQDVAVLGLSWGEVSPDLLLLPKVDVILGSDVFYDPEGWCDTHTHTHTQLYQSGDSMVFVAFI